MPNLIDITGQKFGRLTVIGRVPETIAPIRWSCVCDCGTKVVRTGQSIREGIYPSCGCSRSIVTSMAVSKHRLANVPEFRILRAMIERCSIPKVNGYDRYGARGITVCVRWRDGEGGKSPIECFIEDMGRRPSPQHSIDRIDNDRGYEPGNCRWATVFEQANNRSATRKIFYKGREMALTDACRLAGSVVHYETAWRRIKDGWSPDRAFSTPPQHTNWPTGRAKQKAHRQLAEGV